ncbi:clavaminate synthase-like protein At3g21360 [Telopea speciosissima]|uniref:clavaminate synthase-like protein At3g21360 n=1 Tax=Telopea speciosissima TaxID=54955 RepID=UPI001CC408AA|nr:clavaminate synthase-like protein At3g21360 [Telopea speciosissima]
MALIKQFSSKIFFFCAHPSPEGGKTSIVPSHIIVEKMEERAPEFVTKLLEMGCVIWRGLPKEIGNGVITSKTWKYFLQLWKTKMKQKRGLKKVYLVALSISTRMGVQNLYMNP